MKPYRPDVLKFTSPDKLYCLKIPRPPKPAVLRWIGKTYKWPQLENPNPKHVLFNKQNKQIILIGALGDPGNNLGEITIFSQEGDVIQDIDLKKDISNLEAMSQDWSDFNNFPWIADVSLNAKGDNLTIWVCRQKKAAIDLNDFKITIQANNTDLR